MTDETNRIRLSPDGELRRRDIGEALLRRAGARRVGRTALGAAACVAVLASAGLLARAFVSSPITAQPQLAHRSPVPSKAVDPTPNIKPPTPSEARSASEVHIAIFTNEPITDQPCATSSSQAAATPPTSVPICILNDAQLLSALSTTGESYGLVRVGGRTMVVSNTAR